MAIKPCVECGKDISTDAKACPHCGKRNPTRKGIGPLGIGCLTLLAISVVVSLFSGGSETTSDIGIAQAPVPAPNPKAMALETLKLDFSWEKGGFENVMIVDFVITNNGARPVRDLTVRCTHYAPSGTEIDRNVRTIYEMVPAGRKKRVPDFNMGFIHTQAKTSACEITDFEFAP